MAATRSNRSHRAVDPRGDWLEPSAASKPVETPPATAAPKDLAVTVTAPVTTAAPEQPAVADEEAPKNKKEKKAKKEKKDKDKEKKSKKIKKDESGRLSANGSVISASSGSIILAPVSPRAAVLDHNTQQIEDRYLDENACGFISLGSQGLGVK